MYRTELKPDSPEVLQRYLQRVLQRVDRRILKWGKSSEQRGRQKILELFRFKSQFELLLQKQNFDNLDALKWELKDIYPDFQDFF